jgi:hypothetical protein
MKAKEGRSEPEIKKIASILDEFKDVFSTNDDDLGTTNILVLGKGNASFSVTLFKRL